jgi:hypothetical protein
MFPICSISEEHTKRLGHLAHYDGKQVDVFHYYTLNSVSGGQNFQEFLNLFKSAFSNKVNLTDLQKITDWISAHRTMFDELERNQDVHQFLTHYGNLEHGLPKNWLRTLMNNGKLGNIILLIKDIWTTPTKLGWMPDYKDHIHIKI